MWKPFWWWQCITVWYQLAPSPPLLSVPLVPVLGTRPIPDSGIAVRALLDWSWQESTSYFLVSLIGNPLHLSSPTACVFSVVLSPCFVSCFVSLFVVPCVFESMLCLMFCLMFCFIFCVPCFVSYFVPCFVSYFVPCYESYLIPCFVPYFVSCFCPMFFFVFVPCFVSCFVQESAWNKYSCPAVELQKQDRDWHSDRHTHGDTHRQRPKKSDQTS